MEHTTEGLTYQETKRLRDTLEGLARVNPPTETLHSVSDSGRPQQSAETTQAEALHGSASTQRTWSRSQGRGPQTLHRLTLVHVSVHGLTPSVVVGTVPVLHGHQCHMDKGFTSAAPLHQRGLMGK